jgi:hypothetical protein
MFHIKRNPHASFGMGHPNLKPMGKIIPFKSDPNQYVPSPAEVKAAVYKGLERQKK